MTPFEEAGAKALAATIRQITADRGYTKDQADAFVGHLVAALVAPKFRELIEQRAEVELLRQTISEIRQMQRELVELRTGQREQQPQRLN